MMDQKILEEMEMILCMKGKSLFIGTEMKGMFFAMDDFKELLKVFGQLYKKEGE